MFAVVDDAVIASLLADRVFALLSIVSFISDGVRAKANDARVIAIPRLAVTDVLPERIDGNGVAVRLWSVRERKEGRNVWGDRPIQ